MSKPIDGNVDSLSYEETLMAPVIYFDAVAAYGTIQGTIQIELASRILTPQPDGAVQTKFMTSGRLRCSPTAAVQLREFLDAALKMLNKSKQGPFAGSKLN